MVKAEEKLGGGRVEYASFHLVRLQAEHHLKELNVRDWSGLRDLSRPQDMASFAGMIVDFSRAVRPGWLTPGIAAATAQWASAKSAEPRHERPDRPGPSRRQAAPLVTGIVGAYAPQGTRVPPSIQSIWLSVR
jgi:hypothetical protein